MDTGSMISSVAASLVEELGLQVQPLDELLRVQAAGGQLLQYLGYIEVGVSFPDMGDTIMDALLLVVPDTSYHSQVPVLIGTNLMTDEFFDNLLNQDTSRELPTAWRKVSLAKVGQRKMEARTGRLGVVKTTKETVVPAGGRVLVKGLTHAASATCMRTSVMVEEVSGAPLPGGLLLSPCLLHLSPAQSTHRVAVEVANYSTKDVKIPVKCRIGEVHLVQRVVPEAETCDEPRTPTEETATGEMCGSHQVQDDPFLAQFDESLKKHLDDTQVAEVRGLLDKWRCVFSQHDLDLGHTDQVKHRIRLTDDTPFKERHRRIPPSMIDEVRQHLQEMLDLDVIRKSESPYSSNVVLVKKGDKSLRFCLDLRRLNSLTIRDAYAIPRIEETLDALKGACWFSTLDLKSSYWQVEIAEEDKHKTAFTVGPLGFFECNRMPFGLTNAPATFQRLMESCMDDLYLKYCLLYLDDVVVYSKTYEEHLHRLEAVLQRIHEAGLKLKPSKCKMFQKSIKYLGHIVSEDGVATDPSKIADIVAWPVPKNASQLQSFLGFAGFYRRFIQKFSNVARPLHDAIPKTSGLKRRQIKSLPFNWGPPQQKAFDQLKELCSTTPVLAFADYTKPFILHTDASMDGLGGVLYQEQDGRERVIAFASRRLSRAERNYPVHKLEFLALKWAVCEKFHDYLYGNSFEARTDNNPLTYVLSTAKLDATGHRWVSALANYNFNIVYRSGKTNIDADALSRIKWPEEAPQYVSAPVVCAALSGVQIVGALAEVTCLSAAAMPDEADGTAMGDTPVRDWAKLQREDRVIRAVIKLLEGATTDVRGLDKEGQALWQCRKQLQLRDNILYRKRLDDGDEVFQLVLPPEFRDQALRGCHDDVGHMGRERTMALLRDRFFWPGMTKSVVDHVEQCPRCIRAKTPPNQRAPLVNI